jgi:hypothetical protein
MEGRQERAEPLDRAYDLSYLSGEVEAVGRGDRSMQQCLRSPGSRRTRLACRSSPSSRHRAPGWPLATARLARSTGGTASGIPPSSHPHHRLQSVRNGPGTARWVLGRGPEAFRRGARLPEHDLAGTDRPGWTAAVGAGNGLAGGAGAASGPLHPAADRPLSRPPGQSHAATGPRQERSARSASLRDRRRRPLTLARAARAGVHAAPWGGRSQAGRPRAPTPG